MPAKPKYKIELITSGEEEEEQYFELLRFRMTPGGLEITAKSPTFGAYFASKAQKTATGLPSIVQGRGFWVGGKYFNLSERFPPREARDLFGVASMDYGFFVDGVPNMIWLCHKDLAEGFQLLIPQPMSINNLEDYSSSAATFIQNFHKTCLSSASVEMRFTVTKPRPQEA